MTISDQLTPTLITATGASPNFAFNHPVRTSAELIVTKKPLATGVDQVLVLGVDYTVTGTPDANGFFPNGVTVVTTITPLSGDKVSIVRNTNLTQTAEYIVADKFPAKSHEAALDKLTYIAQEQAAKFAKVPQFPSTSSATGVKFPDPVAGKGLYYDSATNSYKNTDLNINDLATNAAGSAAAASASATAASGSASAASTSASNASTSATNAAASAVSAAASLASLQVRTINNRAAAYTVDSTDRNKLVQLTAGNITFGFTAAATLGSGFELEVRNAGNGILTLDPNGSELIDGAATIQLATKQSVVIVCDGTQWIVTQSYGYGGTSTVFANAQDVITAIDTTKALNPQVAAVPFRKGADIASAATIILPNSSANVGGYHEVTGTTGISSITQTAPYLGREVELRFNAILTLTQSASLQLINGGPITVAQGDTARFRCYDDVNNFWRMVSYQRQDGTPLAKKFASSLVAVANGSMATVAHGLGAKPTMTRLVLVCITAANGYIVGDELDMLGDSNAAGTACALSSDTTSCYITTGNGGINTSFKTSGATTTIVTASWNWKVYASL